jgi:hypothetical protein
VKKRARELRAGDHFRIEVLDDFGVATRVELTARSVTTVTPVHTPREATTRIWADSGRPAPGPGAGNEKIPLDVPSDTEIDVT